MREYYLKDEISDGFDVFRIQYIKEIFECIRKNFSERDNAIFHLYLQGYTQDEIADMTSSTQATTSRVVCRIREKLKKNMVKIIF